MILSDGEDVRDLVPTDDDSIRLIHLDRQLPIGEKRNYACSRARGEIIVHWDDDDHSAPGRISSQAGRLHVTGKACTGYHTMRFVDAAGNWWLYSGALCYALGTSLCYRKDWWQAHPFPALQIGEDSAFDAEAWISEQLVIVDAGDLMFATIHSGNSSPRNLTGASWKRL